MRLRVIPLGTSAGRPTLLRGASALAVATEGSWALCDCGEGAQVAAQRAGLSLARLDAILITHLHGDHFNGLPGLLGTLGLEGRERPLLVVGPRGIRGVLEALTRAGSLGIGPLPLHLLELAPDQKGPIEWPLGMGSLRFETGPLSHRVPTHGYRVSLPDRPGNLDARAAVARGVPPGPLLAELKAGRAVRLEDGSIVEPDGLVGPGRKGASISYLLDTVPCQGAVELGRGTDLLIHESTYEHARAQLAHDRGHTTSLEAARIASEAGARRLLLTHFSPSVNPEQLADEARAVHEDTVAARDGDEVEVPND